MDYEKKYKEALERARQFSEKPYLEDSKGIVDYIFPELKESDDEKMSKALVEMVHDTTGDSLWIDYNVHKEDAIAWLEKQGEHANFRNKIQIGDKVTRNEDGVLVNLSQLNRVAKKQGEQKPAELTNSQFVEKCKGLSDLEKYILSLVPTRPIDAIKVDARTIRHLVEQEQKSAWSEEDENLFRCAIDAVREESKVRTDGCLDEEVGEMVIDWLKSIRPQKLSNVERNGKNWKPSEEQIEALEHSLGDYNIKIFEDRYEILKSLYNELKKLREE